MSSGSRRFPEDEASGLPVLGPEFGSRSNSSWHRAVSASALRCPGSGGGLAGGYEPVAQLVEGFAAQLPLVSTEFAHHPHMRSVQRRLQRHILALEHPPLILPGHLPPLLADPLDPIEIQLAGRFHLLGRRSGFSQAGFFQHPGIGDLARPYPRDLAFAQPLGQIHEVAGGRTWHIC